MRKLEIILKGFIETFRTICRKLKLFKQKISNWQNNNKN